MKDFDYSVIKNHKLYNVLMPIAKIVTRITVRVRYEGMENIPENGGFILASNHITALDPVHIGSKFPLPVHFMGKQEAFNSAFTNLFFTNMNSFPVARGSADKSAVEYAIRLVNEGCVLGIFPEGTRSKDYKPAAAKSGVALIAKAAHADILPVSIYTSDEAKFQSKLTIRFGEMIHYDELGFSDAERSAHELKAASRLIMERIVALWEKGHDE